MKPEMKANLITISVFLVAAFFWYLSKSQHDKKETLKSFPTKYAYTLHKHDSSVSRALGSESSECSIHIKEYEATIERGVNVPIPACTDFSVHVGETVHILSEEDSIAMKVAYFYIASNKKERHVVGYLLKENLHEHPYLKKNSERDPIK